MKGKIEIDKSKCIGCGSCEAVCPKVFKLKDGKAIAKETNSDCIEEAKNSCPVGAIAIIKK